MSKVFTGILYSNSLSQWIPVRFERFEKSDIPRLMTEDWDLPFDDDWKDGNYVYKLIPSDMPKRIEGLISFCIRNQRIHIMNIEKYNWKRNNDYFQTGVCLISLACLFSVKNELKGKISLEPKDRRKVHNYYTDIGMKFVSLQGNKQYVINDFNIAKEFINRFKVK